MTRFVQGDRPEAGAELAMTGWKSARLFLGVTLASPQSMFRRSGITSETEALGVHVRFSNSAREVPATKAELISSIERRLIDRDRSKSGIDL
jgi:hypothetical protein